MKALGLLAAALIVAVPAVGDKKDETRFSPGEASSYASKQTNDEVTIAVKAYDGEELAHTAFGKVNPYQYGILPILVIVQNDTDQSLRLDRLQVAYTAFDGKQIDATPAADVPFTIGGPRRPSASPMPNPLPPELRKKRKNPLSGPEIETRAFAAQMLPPHESAHGFFYFQAHHRPGDSVTISGIKQAASGKDLFYFEIPLKD